MEDAEADATAATLACQPIPDAVRDELLPHVESALRRWGSVAVRSSASLEDSRYLSFAGIFCTFLGVRDAATLLQRVTQCFAAIFSSSCRRYLAASTPTPLAALEMSVVIQAMVPADRAGVLLTADAVKQNHSIAIVNASYGLGDTVVHGRVSPDTYVVRKSDYALVDRRLGAKDTATRLAQAGGTETYTPSPEVSSLFALNSSELSSLVSLGKQLESFFAFYQDIEWATVGRTTYLLQSRPLTNTRLVYREESGD